MTGINTIIKTCTLLSLLFSFFACDDLPTQKRMFQLTNDDNIYASNPVWSPDGNSILFSGASFYEGTKGLWTIDTNGGNLTLLLGSEEIGPEYIDLYPFDYSDDAYLLFSDDSSILASNIYYLPPDGGDPVYIFQGAHPTVKGNLDGVYNIAYYYEPPLKGPNGIYLTDIHGSEPQLVIAYDFIYGPHWSPDGNNLTYYKGFDSDGYWLQKLCVYDFTTQNEEVLLITDSWGSHSPRWSPDGEWIAFVDLYKGTTKNEVYIIPSDGGEPTRLTEFPYAPEIMTAGARNLFWSPNGKWIAFDLKYSELWKVSVE